MISMLLHAIRRSAEILRTQPAKALMVFTPRGWRRFSGLMHERDIQAKVATAREARTASQRAEFESAAWSHEGLVSQRRYENYQQYLSHQQAKLDKIGGEAFRDRTRAVSMFRRRFESTRGLPKTGALVLCLGARRGEEVAAFKEIGYRAIGIDLNPGSDNPLVVPADFHALPFAPESFDVLYTNCLDHAFDLKRLMAEVTRVLKPGGLFLVDIVYGHGEGYAVGEHDAMHWTTARGFAERLALLSGFQVDAFRDLAQHGSEWWTQAELRKT